MMALTMDEFVQANNEAWERASKEPQSDEKESTHLKSWRSLCAKEKKPRYWQRFNESSMNVVNEEIWGGKDAVKALKKGISKSPVVGTIGNFMGIAVISAGIVPDDELWFIQNGKLVQKFKVK